LSHDLIRSSHELASFCDWLAAASAIALDTEFVSEDCYRPQLCLVQVAAQRGSEPQRLAVIDPIAVDDVAPFWRAVAEGAHETIVHAGRQEFLFCYEATGKPPARLLDVQIGAGFVGREYPASYSSLVGRLLGKSPKQWETRTNWRRRPLSDRQVDYALNDVRYLLPLRSVLETRLAELGRGQWMRAEMVAWQTDLQRSLHEEPWRRLGGLNKLSPRELGIVRELWSWREEEAARRNQPARRVLRDDLVVELARRASADPQRIHAVRGFERRDFGKLIPRLAERIDQALRLPPESLPQPLRREEIAAKRIVLGQFLAAALAALCREAEISPGLLGGPNDVRDLIAYRLGEWPHAHPPALAVGWRADVVGHTLEELLTGKLAVRIGDADSEQPLVFEATRQGRKRSAEALEHSPVPPHDAERQKHPRQDSAPAPE
jgi:ribonuclease D